MASLNKDDFIRILRQFADDPDEVVAERDCVLCRLNRTDVTLTLSLDEDDVLYCDDGARKCKARSWIELNLARLDCLADRILSEIPEEQHFVPVSSIMESPQGESQDCSATTDRLFSDLGKRYLYTSAVYLLSNAGDGKTMVMNRLARMTAKAYKEGRIHFLFLPIELGGRPFMRFDDLFIGELARKFRFRDYYFNSLIELIKLGLIVLGLDGFEEMSVEGKDDKVISSLGELLSQFDSKGKIIISARKAFYEYALENRIALGDVMEKHEIEFSACKLVPWSIDQFCALLDSYGFIEEEKNQIVDTLVHRLGEKHPILRRPFLAHKLVDYIYQQNGECASELEKINVSAGESEQSAVLDDFVALLMHREATEKWIKRSADSGGQQLLKIEDHFQILQCLSEEMWLSRTEQVSKEFLKEWMGVICGANGIGVADTRDCQEKILYHAFLKNEANQYSFCHEAFGMYFLGRQIGSYLTEDVYSSQLFQLLSIDVLPDAVIDEIAFRLTQLKCDFSVVTHKLLALKGGISRNTPLSENVGAILISFRNKSHSDILCALTDLYFSKAAMRSVSLNNIKFVRCMFEDLQLKKEFPWKNVEFVDSQIDTIDYDSEAKVKNVKIDDTSIPSKVVRKLNDIYNPSIIRAVLRRAGLTINTVDDDKESTLLDSCSESEEMSVLLRVVRYFSRTYYITENVLAVKFGAEWNHVQKDIFPIFIKNSIIELSSRQRSGSTDGYRLVCSLPKILKAQKRAQGDFEAFLSALTSIK